MKAAPLPPIGILREAMTYCPDTGMLTWKARPVAHFKNAHAMNTFNANFAGRHCTVSHARGYVSASIAGKRYLGHRLAWKLMTGSDPAALIDHINGNTSDNRWPNLREATQQQNGINRGATSKSKTGAKGVVFDRERQKFAAYITDGGKTKFVGRFTNIEEASIARLAAEAAAHGKFAHQHVREAT